MQRVHAPAAVQDFEAWETCSVLWSLAKISYFDRKIVLPLLRNVRRQAPDMQPEGIGLVAWAIVTMELYVRSSTYKSARSALKQLARHAFKKADLMSAQVRLPRRARSHMPLPANIRLLPHPPMCALISARKAVACGSPGSCRSLSCSRTCHLRSCANEMCAPLHGLPRHVR